MVWIVVVVSSSALRGIRSASAPPTGPEHARRAGTRPRRRARSSSTGRSCAVTKMPTPTVSIHVPMLERNAPVQNAAKTR